MVHMQPRLHWNALKLARPIHNQTLLMKNGKHAAQDVLAVALPVTCCIQDDVLGACTERLVVGVSV